MSNDNKFGLTDKDYLLAEVVMKVAAIERLLIKSGVFTADQFTEELKVVSKEIITYINNYSHNPDLNENKSKN